MNQIPTTAHRTWRLVLAATTLAIALLGTAGMASAARVQVDPTSLTPPLKAFRVCVLEGERISCDTSTTDSWANVPILELPCGTLYESATRVGKSVRYYNLDKLLVERNAVEKIDGSWTLSPVGAGPALTISADDGWHEHFVVPGDLSSDVEQAHGSFLHVKSVGSTILDTGFQLSPGDIRNGHEFGTPDAFLFDGTDPAREAVLCAALTQ